LSLRSKIYYHLYKIRPLRDFYKKIFWRNKVFVGFYPTFLCNYECPYCVLIKLDYLKKFKVHGGKEWADAFNKLPPLMICVAGGEPFIWNGLPDFLKYIDKKHYFTIFTNLSWEPEKHLDIFKPCKANFAINCSFHPHTTDLKTFISKVKKLQDAGLKVSANIMTYPDLLNKIKKYKQIFEKENIPLEVQAYIDPNYTYTSEENEKVKKLVSNPLMSEREISGFDSSATLKECSAGITNLFIVPNGDIYKCVAGFYYVTSPLHKKFRAKKEEFYMGNVFDGTFKLENKKTLCRYPCSEACDITFAKPRIIKELHKSEKVKSPSK